MHEFTYIHIHIYWCLCEYNKVTIELSSKLMYLEIHHLYSIDITEN